MKTKNIALFTSLIGLAALSASAQTGTLPAGNDFGGHGIPIDTVEVTTITAGSDTITLGLDATQRSPASPIVNNGDLYNNGSGTYFAAIGQQWNFDFYASIAGGGDLSDYKFVLNYELTPGSTPLGSWDLNTGLPTTTTTVQNSEFPGFGFLATTSSLDGITAPAGPYNVNATGDYDFILDAYNASGTLIGSDDITVSVPDVTSTLSLLGLGLGALAGLRRRWNRA